MHLTNTSDPYSLATATDGSGTTAWFGGEEPAGYYFYGFALGSNTFLTGNIAELEFPLPNFYSYGMTFADGSFWAAGSNESTGIARISIPSTGSPSVSYYATPTQECTGECSGIVGQEIYGISGAGGNVWAFDWNFGNIDMLQYGAQGTGTVQYTAHRIGAFIDRRNTHPSTGHHAVKPRPR